MSGRPIRAQATKLHHERMERALRPDATPELADAWHSLQLHWLQSVPGYREEIQARVLQAHAERDGIFGRGHCMECGGDLLPGRYTKGCQHCDDRRRKHQRRNGNIDLLGQEIEGCG